MNNENLTYQELIIEIENLKKKLSDKIDIENSLRASEENYRTMVQYASEPIFCFNPDETYRFVNDCFAKTVGLLPNEIIGKTPHSIFPYDEAENRLNVVRQVFRTGEIGEIEVKIVKPGNQEMFFKTIAVPVKDEQNTIRWITCISKNVTELKRKVEENENKYKIIFEHSAIPIWEEDFSLIKDYLDNLKANGITDFRNYFDHHIEEICKVSQLIKIVDINRQTVKYFNFGSKEEIIQHIYTFFKEIPIEIYKNELIALAEGEIYYECEIPTKGLNGEALYLSFFLHVCPGYEHDLSKVLVSFIDITQSKLAELQLKKKNEEYKQLNLALALAKEKAEESDQLKTAFFHNISHEIRTPLNAIIGFSQIIAKQNQQEGRFSKYAEILSINSNKLLEIVTDVIEVSEIQSKQSIVKKSEFDFIELINELENEFSTAIKNKDLAFIINIKPDITEFRLTSDRNKLKTIIKHLISNSLKFTYKGSIILDFQFTDDKIEFSVIDTGIGISEAMKQIIFEPFRQVEIDISRNFGGTGLGLAIVKGYVQLLNGTITVQSENNVGSTFTLSLPVEQITDINKIKKSYQLGNIKFNTLLIVEDELSNFEYLKEILGVFCPNIIYATNGQQAIDICRDNKQIELILMDIKMPIMDGHTAIKLIKAFRPDLPIIAQTAYAMENDKEKFLESGFDGYIYKPIHEKTLFAALDPFVIR
jgi:PAS domain S-box-containing protein